MIYLERDPTLLTLLKQKGLLAYGLDPGPLDNWEGPQTKAAYEKFLADEFNVHSGIASVFADVKDLQNFAKCKATGKSDRECFGPPLYGDNGIGASGSVTAQMMDPMVALHPLDIRAKWGEMSKAWGKPVLVTYRDKTCRATLEDYMSSTHADIDLNPAAVAQLGIPDGAMVPVTWAWA